MARFVAAAVGARIAMRAAAFDELERYFIRTSVSIWFAIALPEHRASTCVARHVKASSGRRRYWRAIVSPFAIKAEAAVRRVLHERKYRQRIAASSISAAVLSGFATTCRICLFASLLRNLFSMQIAASSMLVPAVRMVHSRNPFLQFMLRQRSSRTIQVHAFAVALMKSEMGSRGECKEEILS